MYVCVWPRNVYVRMFIFPVEKYRLDFFAISFFFFFKVLNDLTESPCIVTGSRMDEFELQDSFKGKYIGSIRLPLAYLTNLETLKLQDTYTLYYSLPL